MVTIGGGEILDARPRRHRRSDLTVRDRLQTFKDAPIEERIAALVRDADVRTITVDDLVARLGLTPNEATRSRRACRAASSPDHRRPSDDGRRRGAFDQVAAAIMEEVRAFTSASRS